ncbi:MAG: nitroreductase family protein [bacterium]
MKLKSLILENRSCRRFHQEKSISKATLVDLIDLARLSASGANLQPLKFIISYTPDMNKKIFPALAWAGYLEEWAGPKEGEKPSAYIIILGDKTIKNSFGCDHGIAAQSILLGAVEKGLGGCMMGSINRKDLKEALHIDSKFEILLVIALGKPAEEIKIETTKTDGDIKYWRDEQGVHHVPKRPLDEILLKI